MAKRKIRKGMNPAQKKAYLGYYKTMRQGGKQPMTQHHWFTSGRRTGYMSSKGGTSAGAKLYRSDRKAIGMKD